MFLFVCKDNSEQGGVHTGYEVCTASGEWACFDNVFTVYFSGGSSPTTVNPKKDLKTIVAQRSVCVGESVQPSIFSPLASPGEKRGSQRE